MDTNEATVAQAISRSGWTRDLSEIRAIGVYTGVFGFGGWVKPAEGVGRGTTLIDAGRIGPQGRYNFLSLKGSTIGSDGRLPRRADLTTAGGDIITAAIQAAGAGVSIPVVHYASLPGSDHGFILAYDAASMIRAAGFTGESRPTDGPWKKGEKPALTLEWSSPRKSGGKRTFHAVGLSADGWTRCPTPVTKEYPILCANYAGAGLSRAWREIALVDVADFIESAFDWNAPGFRW